MAHVITGSPAIHRSSGFPLVEKKHFKSKELISSSSEAGSASRSSSTSSRTSSTIITKGRYCVDGYTRCTSPIRHTPRPSKNLADLPAMPFRVIRAQNRITLDMDQGAAEERMRINTAAWTSLNTLQYDGLGWYQEVSATGDEPHQIRPTDAEACVTNQDLTVTCNTIKGQSKAMQRWYNIYTKKEHPYQVKEKQRSTKSVKKSKPGEPAKPAKTDKAGPKSARPTTKSTTSTSSLPDDEETRARKKKHCRGCMRYYVNFRI